MGVRGTLVVVFSAVNKSPHPSHLWSTGHSDRVISHFLMETCSVCPACPQGPCVLSPRVPADALGSEAAPGIGEECPLCHVWGCSTLKGH